MKAISTQNSPMTVLKHLRKPGAWFRTVIMTLGLCSFSELAPASNSVAAPDWLYTVRKGDTLWNLCKTYTHVVNCWQKIGEYNGVEYPRVMSPGTRIRFPTTWLKNPPTTVKVTYVTGDVSILKLVGSEAGSEPTLVAAESGSELSIGDAIQTSAKASATLEFAEGSILIMEENSYVVMDLLSLSGEQTFVDTRINLLKGAVRTQVPKSGRTDTDTNSELSGPSSTQAGPQEHRNKKSDQGLKSSKNKKIKRRFEVHTPSAVAAVRGTEFRVSAWGEGEKTSGEVYEGLVSVAKNDNSRSKAKRLAKKFGMVVDKNSPLGEPIELLDAPNMADARKEYLLPLNIAWDTLPDAESYVVSLFPREQKNSLLEKVQTTQPSIEFVDLELGCYAIAVRGVAKNGLQGLVSSREFCLFEPLDAPEVYITHDKSYNRSELTWREVAGASEYLVEFSRNDNFSNSVKAVPVYSPNYSVSIVEKKLFDFVRVRAVTQSGLRGLPSVSLSTKP